jgi:AcrR family transcriptional regulator
LARKRTTTPTTPNDARARRSIEALRNAFLELIEEKPLDQIAIREITERASVSYPTFFRRFASKEDLLKDIASDEVVAILTLGRSAIRRDVSDDSGEALCRHIQERRRLWTALLTGGAAAFVRDEFMRVGKRIASERPRINPWLPLELAVAFVSSGIFEILAWWMRQPEDYPVKNVVTLFNALIIDSAGRPRDITLD